jgi:tetratricopeptide (TPR) repeat protein
LREELATVGTEYLKSLSNEDLLKAENFNAFSIVGAKFESDKFQYVYNNKAKFVAIVGEETVSNLIMYTYYNYMQEVASGNDFDKLKNVIADYQKLYPDPRNEFFAGQLYTEHYLANSKFNKWFKLTEAKIKKAKEEGDKAYAETLVRSAYGIARDDRFAEKPEFYDKAIFWVNTAIERDADVEGTNLCFVQLYQKKGDKANALRYLKIFEEKNPTMSERKEMYVVSLKEEIEKM